MKKSLSLGSCLIFVTLLSFNAFAQNPSTLLTPQGKQPLVGVSAERLDRIDKMLDQTLSDNQVPGLVALIVKDGKIVYHEAKGMADVPSGTKMAKDQIFRI